MIKENKRTVFLILLSMFLLADWFYWFQYRPAKIRHDCSWIKQNNKGVPARPALSLEQIQRRGLLKKCDGTDEMDAFKLIDLADGMTCEDLNKRIIEEYSQPKPEIPPSTSWKKASAKEYSFCLHDHGL